MAASARHSSVLPTPVGPRKRKLPTGRAGSFRPTRLRRMARATADTASSCPIIRFFSSASRFFRRSVSSLSSPVTGISVQCETTAATSAAVTSSPGRAATCTPAAASSTRSMALSGRKRSFIYRTESS